MLSYFTIQNKAFKKCEDSHTSILFDNLKHLPDDLIFKIIKKSLFHDKLPDISGELLSISLWDHWDSEYTSNSYYIEPDVFIRFEGFDLIIEAKRYDEKQQNENQCINEINGYLNHYELDYKKIYFIQLGGLLNKKDEENISIRGKEIVICKTNWTQFLHAILEIQKYTTKNHHIRILNDLINGFALHGISKIEWLTDLKPISIKHKKFGSIIYFHPKSKILWMKDLNRILLNNEFNQMNYGRT